jgi:hypothetical protein
VADRLRRRHTHARLQLTGIAGPGGQAVLRGLRAHLAENDRLDRQTREGILALIAAFAPAPAPDDISVLGDAGPAVDSDVPVAEQEFAAHI